MTQENHPQIGVVMGSDSDFSVMEEAVFICRKFAVETEVTIVSAHRTPERLIQYGKTANERGLKIIIAGAGGAAHLPGMLASLTTLPVIGVPILSSNSIDGWDSILSILQMPAGVPVATVALNGATNAGLLALRMLSTTNGVLLEKMLAYQNEMKEKVISKVEKMQEIYPCNFKKNET